MRPRLLDLFCCGGGCSMGYYDAGFDLVGCDLTPRRDYPFEFIEADALELLADKAFLDSFDVVHASPPCQRYSVAASAWGNADTHPDLLPPTRDALRAWGGNYIIENVPTAPMRDAVLLCGWAMGLKHIKRHRLFETNMPLMSPGCMCPAGDTVSVYGHSGEDRRKATMASRGGQYAQHLPIHEIRDLMHVPWINGRDEISESIPPPYTQFLGEQIISHLVAA